ncbi:MAG TPA: hypothetical protein VMW27_30300 [Thermoanaerobaculia bacterium]|nr:hypothetical protein [Thermoanaerobaculia bacterium]
MNRNITLSITLALSVLWGADAALACSCAPLPEPQQAKDQAAAVFTGTVLGITQEDNRRLVRLRVEESWKGAKCGEVTVTTGLGDADCGYAFQEGQTYLIYADKDRGKLTTNICSRTRPAAEAGDDLTALGTPAADCAEK